MRKLAIIVLVMAFVVTSCFSITYTTKKNQVKTEDVTAHTFIFGLVGSKINVEEYCEKGEIAQMNSKVSFLSVLVSWITIGIYIPFSVEIRCAPASH